MEIEKKFLVEKLPNLEGCKFYEIEQAYLSLDKTKKEEERIRRLDDKFFLVDIFSFSFLLNIKKCEHNILIKMLKKQQKTTIYGGTSVAD